MKAKCQECEAEFEVGERHNDERGVSILATPLHSPTPGKRRTYTRDEISGMIADVHCYGSHRPIAS